MSSASRRLGVLLAALLCTAAAAPAAPPFERKAWQKEHAFLKAELERSYGHLAWMGSRESGVDLPALDRRARRALGAAGSDADAEAALRDLVSGFRDGHLKLVPRLEPAGSPAPALPPVLHDDLDATTGVAALGYALASPVAFSLPFETLKGSTLLNDGVSLPFRAAVVTTAKGTKLGLVRIPRFREQDSPPALAVKEWTARKKPGQPLDVPALKAAITDAWYQAMADHLKRFEREKVAAVIVDVGGNSTISSAGCERR